MNPNSPPASRLWSFQARYAPYLFLSPFIVLFLLFLVYPLCHSIIQSLYKSAGPQREQFVGLGNYRYLFTDLLFWYAVANTALYTIVFLLIQVPASLALAILLNSRRLRFRSMFRFAFFSTHLVGHVFVAILFAMLLSPRAGLVNRALGAFLGHQPELNWLGDPNLAMISILIAALWISIGYGMVYFLAALQGVDRDLYEAADIDGASRWQQFWHVTLPGIKPVLVFMLLVGTISGFQLFELPFVLFQDANEGAGPKLRGLTIVMYLYRNGFVMGNLGYAAAIGWVLVLMISSVAAIQFKVTRATQEA